MNQQHEVHELTEPIDVLDRIGARLDFIMEIITKQGDELHFSEKGTYGFFLMIQDINKTVMAVRDCLIGENKRDYPND